MGRTLLAFILALVPFGARADYRIIPYGTQYVEEFTLRTPDAADLTNGLTITATECKLSKAGAATSNCGTTPTAVSSSDMYTLTVSAAEATTTRIEIVLKSGSSAYFAREFQFDTCGGVAARFPTCPFDMPTIQFQGTCSGASSTTTCRNAALTQADNYWNNWVAIIVSGMPARCVRGFSSANDELQWPQALPSTAANQPFSLVADPSCRTVP